MRLNFEELGCRVSVVEGLFFELGKVLRSDFHPEKTAVLDYDLLWQLRESWRELEGSLRDQPSEINPVMEAFFLEEGELDHPVDDQFKFLAGLFNRLFQLLEEASAHLQVVAWNLGLPVVGSYLEQWLRRPLFELPDPIVMVRRAVRPRKRHVRLRRETAERFIQEAQQPDFIDRLLEDEELAMDRCLIRN